MAQRETRPRALTSTPRILVIRRDNIGDLICTTPLLAGLRLAHPHAWIGVLVHSYNAPVLKGCGDVDEVFVYRKAKHSPGESRLGLLVARARLWLRLRRLALDAVLVASPGDRAERMAAGLRAARIVVRGQSAAARGRITVVAEGKGHEVERVFALGAPLGVTGLPAAVHVHGGAPRPSHGPFTLGVHISARKPSQRWSITHFEQTLLALDPSWRVKLFWAPGDERDPRHPGDDRKAAALVQSMAGRVQPMPTSTLGALVDALAGCDAVLCADGGAMHVAAGLGKPIVCLFGDSDAARWHPWGVPYRLLQAPSRHVDDIAVDAVVAALRDLCPVDGASSTPRPAQTP